MPRSPWSKTAATIIVSSVQSPSLRVVPLCLLSGQSSDVWRSAKLEIGSFSPFPEEAAACRLGTTRNTASAEHKWLPI